MVCLHHTGGNGLTGRGNENDAALADSIAEMTARSRRGIAEYPAKACPTFLQEDGE
jgi:hypothetical protein